MGKLTTERGSTTAGTTAQGRGGDKPAAVNEMNGHLRPIISQLRRQYEELSGSILALERIVGKGIGPDHSPKAASRTKRRAPGITL